MLLLINEKFQCLMTVTYLTTSNIYISVFCFELFDAFWTFEEEIEITSIFVNMIRYFVKDWKERKNFDTTYEIDFVLHIIFP